MDCIVSRVLFALGFPNQRENAAQILAGWAAVAVCTLASLTVVTRFIRVER
jgi:hypothetical protein